MGIGGGFSSNKKRPVQGSVAAFPAYGDRDATLALHGPMETFTTPINVAIYDTRSKTLKYAKRPFRAHVYYVPLRMGSKQQRFLAQVDMFFSSLWVPCDCISCAKGRPEVPKDTPFDSLSSYSVQYLSCSDPRCVSVGVSEFNPPLVGCNDPGKANPYVNTSLIPGNDPLCVYTTPMGSNNYDLFNYDNTTILFANASDPSIGPLDSVGHVIADTLFFPEDTVTGAAAAAADAAAKAAAEAEAEAKAVQEAIAIAVAYGVVAPAPASSAAPPPAAAAAVPPPPPLSNRTIFFGCGSAQSGWWGQQDTWAPNGVMGLGPFSPLLKQLANESMSFAMCLEKPRPWVENVTRWNQNKLKLEVVPLERFDGGSHVMVGPVDFPADASRTEIHSFDGLYIPVLLNTSYSMGNKVLVNHPKANEDVNVIAFSSTIFTHFLRLNLIQAILAELGFATAFDQMNADNTTLACFRSDKDPFTTFPSIRIGFVEGSEFVVPPSGYVAQVGNKEYCFLCHVGEDIDIWAAPALYDKQIYINYPNKTFAWIDTPQCSKNLSFVPPPPSPPPAPAAPKPAARLAPLPTLSWHLVTTTGSLLLLLLLQLLLV
ncbi:unnamed protein product [Closterium sp. Naga37s-1]|nr:unnamed protein product [Closterium sp. Naga37s-1]